MAQRPNLLLLSTSTVHGSQYLDYCEDEVRQFFEGKEHIIFVPFARPGGISHDKYTELASRKFEEIGLKLTGIHKYSMPSRALNDGDGIFVGGGNTFLLLQKMYEHHLMEPIQKRVAEGIPYMGSSAGTNMAGKTIGTTNDMPIVYPPTFNALELLPFNINPHYTDPAPGSRHMGETRETRIREFLVFNSQPVVGLREGSWLSLKGTSLTLGGAKTARIFQQGTEPLEHKPEDDLTWLIKAAGL